MSNCPSCGKPPFREETPWGAKYICYDCELWAWGCKDLVSRATHKARRYAHNEFDRFWREGHMSRSEAYQLLSEHLGLPVEQTHIKLFDEATAIKTMDFARAAYLGEKSDG